MLDLIWIQLFGNIYQQTTLADSVNRQFLYWRLTSSKSGLQVIKKYRQMKKFFALSLSDVVFIMLILLAF